MSLRLSLSNGKLGFFSASKHGTCGQNSVGDEKFSKACPDYSSGSMTTPVA